jgi:biopolymer transport protein ExbD
MKIALRSHHTALAELNLTPLLDLVFVLLVIFIIATPQLMNNLQLALPSEKSSPPPATEPTNIRVLSRNSIQLDSKEMTFVVFKTELARRKAARPDLAVVVEGADRADYQAVVDVLEVIEQLGINQAGLSTSPSGALQNP